MTLTSPNFTCSPAIPATPDPAALTARETFLADLIREAGALARRAFADTSTPQVGMKGPQDFLTETDAAVEDLVRSRIQASFPDDSFLGEETGGVATGPVWVVDPIDGTANFARRIPHYCISIAYVADGEIRLGAIYDPSHDELYAARQGRGATRNGTPIRVAQTTRADAACLELGWSNRLPNATYLAVLTAMLEAGANVRRAATGALGLAYVADGRSDGYAELHMHPWDCLAGLLLVEEAGGRVCGFLEADGLNKGGAVLATAPGLAELMSRATNVTLREAPN
ncbi:MAG: inositol monophosphatase family protein [Pseudotabrizicola sp.]|uniref:inositol monophosphatase family protein n=1 Tax=Pseudotabrizicola sp. TaxID=2939647 RepID=UPI00271B3020|nr:inositol monophosphatase family protein [Pseudotabrizicola sp.]MDO9640610.1 inositol monophosphatase family protein [Pseudotabrizicola sp.]